MKQPTVKPGLRLVEFSDWIPRDSKFGAMLAEVLAETVSSALADGDVRVRVDPGTECGRSPTESQEDAE